MTTRDSQLINNLSAIEYFAGALQLLVEETYPLAAEGKVLTELTKCRMMAKHTHARAAHAKAIKLSLMQQQATAGIFRHDINQHNNEQPK